MLERRNVFGLQGGLLVALGLALAVPAVGCKKKSDDTTKGDKEDDDKDSKKSKKKKSADDDDDDSKDSKKKKKSSDDDDDSKSAKKKKSSDDDDDDSKTAKKKKSSDDDDDSKSAKKTPKNVDDEEADDDDTSPKTKSKSLKAAGADAEIAGSFSLVGKDASGSKYKGSATISKIGGSMYKGTWHIGSNTFSGVAFKDGNVLSCGWSAKNDVGVVAYLVKKGVLDGVWFEEGNTALGHELLNGPAGDTVSGLYIIKTADTPQKKKYSGTVDVAVYKSGVFGLTWHMGSTTMKGLGLRSKGFNGANNDVLSAGFNEEGGAVAGVLQYIILDDGKVMSGHWAQPTSGKEPNWGIETMIKE